MKNTIFAAAILLAFSACNKDSQSVNPTYNNEGLVEGTLTTSTGGTRSITATIGTLTPGNVIDLGSLMRQISFNYTHPNGCHFWGWIEDNGSHGRLNIQCGGTTNGFGWLVAPTGTNGSSTPPYYSDYNLALANQQAYDDNFDVYVSHSLVDSTTGSPMTFAEIGIKPSEIIFPAWEQQ